MRADRLALALCLALTPRLSPGAEAWEPLLALPLEDLSQFPVQVASKTEETVFSSPSSVTSFSAAQIRQLGLDNVYDLLSYVPGFQVTRGNQIGDAPLLHVRGIGQNNGTVLLLLDGQRLNEISLGNATAYTPHLSTFNVKRIEVIRGPGSAVYGSNALLGVVNIVTATDERQFGLSAGSDEHLGLAVEHELAVGTDGQLSVFAFKDSDTGQRLQRESGGEVRDPKTHQALQLRWAQGPWQAFGNYQQDETEGFLVFGRAAEQVQFNHSRFLNIGVGRQQELGTATLHTQLSYTRHNLDTVARIVPAGGSRTYDFFAGPYSQSSEYQAQAELHWPLSAAGHLLTGLQWRQAGLDYSGAYTSHIAPDHSTIAPLDAYYLGNIERFRTIGSFAALVRTIDVWSAYAQYRHEFDAHWLTFVGARYDDYSVGGNSFNPRLALIYRPLPNHALKLLYGTAYRAPTHNELFSDDPVSQGNPALAPETVATSELVYQWQGVDLNVALSYFHNRLQDLIQTEQQAGGGARFINSRTRRMQGLESAVGWQLRPSLHAQVSYTDIFQGSDGSSFERYGTLALSWQHARHSVQFNTIWRDNIARFAYQKRALLADLHWRYLLHRDLELSAGVFNLGDVRYFSPPGDPDDLTRAVPHRRRSGQLGFLQKF